MAVKLKYLEDYIELILPKQREIVSRLDQIVLESNEKIKFQFKYGLPAYQFIKNICYFNCKKTGEVDIGFWEGIQLTNIPQLELKDRKRIKTFTYRHQNDIDEKLLKLTLNEAMRIQEEMY